MLGSIQGSHSRIRLVPDAQVQSFAINCVSYCRDVVHVSPVHAYKMDGTIAGDTRRGTQGIGEERTELRLAHLARGHRKFAMTSGRHRMPADPHIVRRIEESHIYMRPSPANASGEFRI